MEIVPKNKKIQKFSSKISEFEIPKNTKDIIFLTPECLIIEADDKYTIYEYKRDPQTLKITLKRFIFSFSSTQNSIDYLTISSHGEILQTYIATLSHDTTRTLKIYLLQDLDIRHIFPENEEPKFTIYSPELTDAPFYFKRVNDRNYLVIHTQEHIFTLYAELSDETFEEMRDYDLR